MLYIKKDARDYYIESDIVIETINGYEYSVGTTWKDYLDGKFVLLSQGQIDFHINNPLASIREVFNMQLDPVPERTLEQAKMEMISLIEGYDNSENVNVFYIDDDALWLDKPTRTGLGLRFTSEQALKHETTSIWYGTTLYALNLIDAIQMLYMIEKYASECYDVTQSHIAEVMRMTSINDIDNFDYADGYPEKLHLSTSGGAI